MHANPPKARLFPRLKPVIISSTNEVYSQMNEVFSLPHQLGSSNKQVPQAKPILPEGKLYLHRMKLLTQFGVGIGNQLAQQHGGFGRFNIHGEKRY
jgi:hypothetical protein